MKCPYRDKKRVQIIIIKRSYEDGLENEYQQYTNEEFELSECNKEECGAYYDGKCNYKG